MPETTTAILKIDNPLPFREIDAIVTEYSRATQSIDSRIETMAMMINAVIELRQRLPDSFVARIKKGAENNRLGFKTDKPNGYPDEVVRECLVESLLQGVYPFGNEFNIIAGNSYITKEGFIGLMRRDRRFLGVCIDMEPPVYDKGASGRERAVVKYAATWNFNSRPDKKSGAVPIRLNAGMGDDAVLGKAERKIRCLIWNQATGNYLSDGDADDSGTSGRAERAKPVTAEVTSVESMTGGEAVAEDDDVPYAENEKAKQPTPAKETPAAPKSASSSSTGSRTKVVHNSPSHKELLTLCVTSQILPEIVTEYAASMGFAPSGSESTSEITDEGALEIASKWNGIVSILKNRSDERRAAYHDSGR